MPTRPPILDETKLTAEQQAIFEAIRSGPRGLVEGPLRVWLHSPGLAEPAQRLGAFCRYGTRLPPRLSELAIITVGAQWRSGFEWHVHAPIAARAGIDDAAIEAIRTRGAPALPRADERAVHAFAKELLETHAVSEATYAAAVAEIGLEATVELVGVLGYYTLICMTINAFQVPVPAGAPAPFGDVPPPAL